MAVLLKLALCALLAAVAAVTSEHEAQARGSYVPPPGSVGGESGGSTTTTTSTTTLSPEGEDGDTTGDVVNDACKYEMNKYREMHGSQPLTFSKALLTEATNAANSYASDAAALKLRPGETSNPFKCAFVARPPVADNLGVQFGIANADNSAKIVVANTATRWYQRGTNGWTSGSIPKYNYEKPDFDTIWAYWPFTQMLWNSTTKFACHLTEVTSGGNRILAAVFEPAGNVLIDLDMSLYAKNVKKPVK